MARRPPALDPAARLLTRGLPLILYVAVIFIVSAQPHLKPPMDFPNGDKLWHLAEYGGLAALIARLLRSWNGWSLSVSRVVLAILLASIVGALDERFQAGVPGRDSSVFDWAADTAGAALGAITYASIARGRAGEKSWL